MSIKNKIRKIPPIKLIKEFMYWRKHYRELFREIPPGHYYSPLPDIQQICSNAEKLYTKDAVNIGAVDLQSDFQKELFCELGQYFTDFNFPKEKSNVFRYYHGNSMFGLGSGLRVCNKIT